MTNREVINNNNEGVDGANAPYKMKNHATTNPSRSTKKGACSQPKKKYQKSSCSSILH